MLRVSLRQMKNSQASKISPLAILGRLFASELTAKSIP